MSEEIDYKELLRKYIDHVVSMEGTDFLPIVGGGFDDISDEEALELERLSRQ